MKKVKDFILALLELLAAILFFVVPIIAVLWLTFWAMSLGCHARWGDSGFESKYGIISGCRVQVHGKWIPEERYREQE